MEAVTFVGVRASGETTFFKEQFFRSHVHIGLDLPKLDIGGENGAKLNRGKTTCPAP